MKRKILVVVAVAVLVLSIGFCILFVNDPWIGLSGSSAMNVRQVERCFNRNYEYLAAVASYLEDLDVTYWVPQINSNTNLDFITCINAISAINFLRARGYDRIVYTENVIYFRRDVGRDNFPRGHRWDVGVAYSVDGINLSNLYNGYAHLRGNWFFYSTYVRAS